MTEASGIRLPAVSPAVFYGRSVFTTVAIYNRRPFQWSKHWDRLRENAATIGVGLGEISEEQISTSLAETVNVNQVNSGRARISIFDQSSVGIWMAESENRNSYLITTADFRLPSNDLRLAVSPYPINSKSPLAGVKSANYLENFLALEEARRRGFDEALRLNEKGAAVSGAMANLFWASGEKIFTAGLETGALRGTTRAFVSERFPVIETTASLAELENADEIFLTSAGLGIVRAQSLEKRIFTRTHFFSAVMDAFSCFVEKAF